MGGEISIATAGDYWVTTDNLRLVLDVQVSSGKQHASRYIEDGLGRLLDELGQRRPALVRGDSSYGSEGVLLELEERRQPYLLRLRQTAAYFGQRAAAGGAPVRAL